MSYNQKKLNTDESSQIPYSLRKYREISNHLYSKFSLNFSHKKLLKHLPKLNSRQRELVELVTVQVQQYAKKQAKKFLEQHITEEDLVHKLEDVDYLNMTYDARKDLNEKVWDQFDDQEEFIDQLNSFLEQRLKELDK